MPGLEPAGESENPKDRFDVVVDHESLPPGAAGKGCVPVRWLYATVWKRKEMRGKRDTIVIIDGMIHEERAADM